MPDKIKAAAIGATVRGNYGHGMDAALRGLEGVEFVAIADSDPAGLSAAGKRNGVSNLYRDYREMLAKEKPHVVTIGPRWTDQRVAMVTAAAEAGCQIFCEKPAAGDLVDCDALLSACRKAGVKIAFAHQLAAMPPVRKALAELRAGKYGRLVRIRARGKEDARGGGEDFAVLGCHLLHLMVVFAGPPLWVSGYVGVGDRPATKADAHQATEPIGPVAGDRIAATFGFAGGVLGTFDSRAKIARPNQTPYGVLIECELALLSIREGEVEVYPAPTLIPDNSALKWNKIWVEDWHFFPDHKPRPGNDRLHRGNQILIQQLLAAERGRREPWNPGEEVRWALELVQGTYASHLAGGSRISLPLADRSHPLKTG